MSGGGTLQIGFPTFPQLVDPTWVTDPTYWFSKTGDCIFLNALVTYTTPGDSFTMGSIDWDNTTINTSVEFWRNQVGDFVGDESDKGDATDVFSYYGNDGQTPELVQSMVLLRNLRPVHVEDYTNGKILKYRLAGASNSGFDNMSFPADSNSGSIWVTSYWPLFQNLVSNDGTKTLGAYDTYGGNGISDQGTTWEQLVSHNYYGLDADTPGAGGTLEALPSNSTWWSSWRRGRSIRGYIEGIKIRGSDGTVLYQTDTTKLQGGHVKMSQAQSDWYTHINYEYSDISNETTLSCSSDSTDGVSIVPSISVSELESATIEQITASLANQYGFVGLDSCTLNSGQTENHINQVIADNNLLEQLKAKYKSVAAANGATAYQVSQSTGTVTATVQSTEAVANTNQKLTSNLLTPDATIGDTAIVQVQLSVDTSTYLPDQLSTVFEAAYTQAANLIVGSLLLQDPGLNALKTTGGDVQTVFDILKTPGAPESTTSLNCGQSFIQQTNTQVTPARPDKLDSNNYADFATQLAGKSSEQKHNGDMLNNILATSHDAAGRAIAYNANTGAFVICVRRLLQNTAVNGNDSNMLAGSTISGQATTIAQANAITRAVGNSIKNYIQNQLAS